jgi:hypothetical protein
MTQFCLTRYSTDDGSGIFAAFAEHPGCPGCQRVETILGDGDLRGDLTPQVLQEWAWAMLAHLFGDAVARQHAEALAASDLMAPDLNEKIDWQTRHLALPQSDVVDFVLRRLPQAAV